MMHAQAGIRGEPEIKERRRVVVWPVARRKRRVQVQDTTTPRFVPTLLLASPHHFH